MDDVKDKVKGFMKKVNNPFSSSSSGKFKGQGRVLGGGSSSAAGPATANPIPNLARPAPPSTTAPKQDSKAQSQTSPPLPWRPSPPRQPAPPSEPGAFDPFESLISSGKRSPNGTSVSVFECPVCGGGGFASEDEVSAHVDSCLADRAENAGGVDAGLPVEQSKLESRDELASRIGRFLSGQPSDASVDVVIKLLRNVGREPGNDKFRKIRMSNPKIKEAVGEVAGGVEFLEYVGFSLRQEGDEMWATMEAPTEDRMVLIGEVVSLLESRHADSFRATSVAADASPSTKSVPIERKKIDRQVRVFFSVPEKVAAQIDLPDSFYNLSAEELKREAELRRKRIAESQLLIPKSYKEKQAKAARKRYKATVIRIQFPDGVVLQGVFLPWEPTTTLYEFVSSSLKDPSLEFQLLQPAMPKRRVIPRFSSGGERAPTLDEEELVPSALIKFKPMETDSSVFTGLRNELLQVSEPLTASTALVPP